MLKAKELARQIIEDNLGRKAVEIKQFSTGLSHFVFDVLAKHDFSCVIRIARPERKKEFQRGIFWHQKIENIGIRLPKIFDIGGIKDHPYIVLERLKGDDLENVYASLSTLEKRNIAEKVSGIQQKIALLDPNLFEQIYPWETVLGGIVARSEREILSHGLCHPKYANLVRQQLTNLSEYKANHKPAAFLYDLSVRNVIVDHGKVTGIIDVDDVWYGDPLLAVGRGKTILLAMHQDTIFIEHWCKTLRLSADEMKRVDIYALLYCLRFMGTIGTKLNRNLSIQTDPNNARLFESIADNLLVGLGN